MFNILIAFNESAWETDQLMTMDVTRFGEHSGREACGVSLEAPSTLSVLENIPTLLMYESSASGPTAQIVRFGCLRRIAVVGKRITFRFENQGYFLREVIERYGDHLGINRFEYNRTHWAVKDGDLPTPLLEKLIPKPYRVQITEITRRGIIDALLLRPGSYYGNLAEIDFLKRVWDLASMPSTDHRFENAEGDIWQHTVNNDDWDSSYLLFDYLNLRSCGDDIFLRFAEIAVHPLVGDEIEVAARVSDINTLLRHDGYLLEATSRLSSRPVYTANAIELVESQHAHVYEIVLSFAGEDRSYVEHVAAFLKTHGVTVFYDRYEEATLWGKDLAEHLDQVYRNHARYCVMFLSRHYAEKLWTNHERRSALSRSLEDRKEYILPARFDETEIPGIRPTLGYIDLTQKTPEELGGLILQKLGRHMSDASK